MVLKLYNVTDSPPCTSVRMAIKCLKLDHELINIDMTSGEHSSEEYLKKNPMGQVPCLDDDGFILTESVAIIQYLAEKYEQDETFYPKQLQKKAIVHQRLAFHLSTFYPGITNYFVIPLIFGTPQTEENQVRLVKMLDSLEQILEQQNTTFIAGNDVTIADLPMIMDMVCCEAIGEWKFEQYPKLQEWYEDFKKLELWAVAKECLDELVAYVKTQQKP